MIYLKEMSVTVAAALGDMFDGFHVTRNIVSHCHADKHERGSICCVFH